MSITSLENTPTTTGEAVSAPNLLTVAPYVGVVGCPKPQECRDWSTEGKWNCKGYCDRNSNLGALAAQSGVIEAQAYPA